MSLKTYKIVNEGYRLIIHNREVFPDVYFSRNFIVEPRTNLLTIKQADLFNALTEIEGVQSVSFDAYTIKITKAEIFSWDEIEPTVIALVTNYFGIDKETPFLNVLLSIAYSLILR